VINGYRIRESDGGAADVEDLAGALIDCVEGGASVRFLPPLARDKSVAFWRGALDRAAWGERVVLVAEDRGTGRVVGTVQLVPAMPDNQPHRAEVATPRGSSFATRRVVTRK
jgi:hypothetical protein